MESKEKFLTIKEHISSHYRLGTTFIQLKEPYEKFELNDALDEIEKDLDRLEKLEKAINIVIKYGMIDSSNFDYDFEEKEAFYKDRFIKDADVDVVFEVFELEE